MGEKQSDTFFRVFNDRIQDAQQSIKAMMSANADESLASTENIDNKDSIKDDAKRKGRYSVIYVILFTLYEETILFFVIASQLLLTFALIHIFILIH